MRFSTVFGISALSVALPLLAVADSHAPSRRHEFIARRARNETGDLEKRDFQNARFTYYDVGLGACGITNGPSDFIVALNSAQYGGGYPGPECFKMITINYNGKSAQAQITDECPGCPYGGLDMSRGLFEHFADLGEGVLYGSWSYNGGGGGGGDSAPAPKTTSTHKDTPTPTPTPKPTPTPTPTPEPTTHSETPSTTSTPSSSSSSTSESSSSKSSSSSSHSHSSSSTSSSSSATPSATGNSLESVNQAFLGLAGLVVDGANSSQ